MNKFYSLTLAVTLALSVSIAAAADTELKSIVLTTTPNKLTVDYQIHGSDLALTLKVENWNISNWRATNGS